MRRYILPVVFAFAMAAQDEPETIRTQARSMAMTRYGIVATSQTLASAAGVKILEAGGNAVDAAIAANAVLGLTEPGSNGIGGDLFAIIYEAKTGKLYGLNSSGWAPAGLTHRSVDSRTAKQRCPSVESTRSRYPAPLRDGMQCISASDACLSRGCLLPRFTMRRKAFP